MVKWLPVIAAGVVFLSGCAPVVKENGKTMPRIDGEAKIEWNREKYPLAVEILNSHGEKERQVFYSPPKRVAAVWQNSIETLLALGVGDRIIAGMASLTGSISVRSIRQVMKRFLIKAWKTLIRKQS